MMGYTRGKRGGKEKNNGERNIKRRRIIYIGSDDIYPASSDMVSPLFFPTFSTLSFFNSLALSLSRYVSIF
jgi:hypothetical protein